MISPVVRDCAGFLIDRYYMANCNSCVRIAPLPECIEGAAYNPYYMEGLVFDDADTNMTAEVYNKATDKPKYIDFVTDGDGVALIDATTLYPLMDHVYEMKFVNAETGNPESFTITNADGTTSRGCCVEFGIKPGKTDNNGFFYITTQGCGV